MLCYTKLYYTMIYYNMLCYAMLYYTILNFTIPCYTILCYAMLYCNILCYTLLYYIILFFTMLYDIEKRYSHTFFLSFVKPTLEPELGVASESHKHLQSSSLQWILWGEISQWDAALVFSPVVFVCGLQGGRTVLCLYGYSNQQADGLSFPEDVLDPDVGRVASVTLEVMSLRMELEMLIKVLCLKKCSDNQQSGRMVFLYIIQDEFMVSLL